MGKEEIIVGLDIGTTKIACLVGKKTEHDKIQILGMGMADSIGVNRGVVANIERTVQSIKEAIKQASDKSGVEINQVAVGIAGQHIRSLQHRGVLTRSTLDEEVSEGDVNKLTDDMFKLVTLPGEEVIDALPQEFIIDNEEGIKDPVGMSGIRIEANYHVIVGQTGPIKNIYRCVDKAGMGVSDLVLEPLASADAVLSKDEKDAGVVLVDIGGGTTDIAIFQDGIIRHTAVIPFGGNVITEDIKEGCAILKNQAEQLKVKFGSALALESQSNEIVCIPSIRGKEPKEISLKNLASIIQARMEEIIEHVFYEIKSSGYENKVICGIVITGGGSQLKHVAQLFEYVTGIESRIGYPTEHLENVDIKQLSSPSFATGVGLIIKGFERLKRKGNPNQVAENTEEVDTKKQGGIVNSGKGLFQKLLKHTSNYFEE
ncbi:MAG: cell division protein FtsA [Luteibaculaceae bacterium]